MRVVILEDDRADRDKLLAFCERYAEERGVAIRADAFSRPDELPADMDECDAALLDIMVDERAAGVQAARALRDQGWKGALVFITASADFYPEGFALNAAHYLMKPVQYAAFREAMDRVMEKAGGAARTVTLPVPRGQITLPVGDILYAEVYDHRTLLHTTRNELRLSMTLTELSALLPSQSFLRCFRSCLVNMAHIERVEEAHFALRGGARVPISLRNRQDIHNRYLDYRSALGRRAARWY